MLCNDRRFQRGSKAGLEPPETIAPWNRLEPAWNRDGTAWNHGPKAGLEPWIRVYRGGSMVPRRIDIARTAGSD